MQRKVGDPLGRSEEDGGIYYRRRAPFFFIGARRRSRNGLEYTGVLQHYKVTTTVTIPEYITPFGIIITRPGCHNHGHFLEYSL